MSLKTLQLFLLELCLLLLTQVYKRQLNINFQILFNIYYRFFFTINLIK